METKLKNVTWEFDEINKELLIKRNEDGIYFVVPKRYLFSLNRFLIRIFQRGFYRKHI